MAPSRRRSLQSLILILVITLVFTLEATGAESAGAPRIVAANVVALDQPIIHNRLGSMTPQGMIYALRRDVEGCDATLTSCKLESEGGLLLPGQVRLRTDKRPRPLVLRMNAGDVLQINFTNLLAPDRSLKSMDQPAMRSASVHVVGMQLVDSIGGDDSSVGSTADSLVAPGENRTYRYYSEREGCFVLSSSAFISGGETGPGSISFGLFGAVNVEPRGAEWYRSQVSHDDLMAATQRDALGNLVRTNAGHPVMDYEARYSEGRYALLPVLKMLDDNNEIVHSDLNAIITGPNRGHFPEGTYPVSAALVPPRSDDAGPRKRQEPFREFTVIFHDDVAAVQAFPQLRASLSPTGQDANPLASVLEGVRDVSGINYGMSGLGSAVLSNRIGVGPAAECSECKFEEFFLTSWALGDPALIVDRAASLNVDPATGEPFPVPIAARKALYHDDPSNVLHSYLNDHVKIRNLHAGGRHHLFHLHGHQWLLTPDEDNSSYRDVQGIGPGSGQTYEISYNGTGNRNVTPGDALFHSQSSVAMAQGMWGLWRSHDTFEEGTRMGGDPLDVQGMPMPVPGARALPDGEIVAGTPIPAVVPLPGRPMAPVPGRVGVVPREELPGSQVELLEKDKHPGYPFFIAGIAGHRPPRPPLETIDDGGLPRHVFTGGARGNESVHHAETRLSFDKGLIAVKASFLPEGGTDMETLGMGFHSRRFHPTFLPDGTPAGDPEVVNDPAGFKTNGLPPVRGAPYADPCVDDFGQQAGVSRTIKAAVFQLDLKINKVEWHTPQARLAAHWQDVGPIIGGEMPPEPFFARASSNDCIELHYTNLLPRVYEMDDFHIRKPTDVVGLHANLLKVDLTSSDGSASGWNYEDGALSPGEVRERIAAINAGQGGREGRLLEARAHPFFSRLSVAGLDLTGAQTTVQRWYADPTVNNKGEDRTVGTSLLSDHLGLGTHQRAGLYGLLGIEPEGSTWRSPLNNQPLGGRDDGGPTSYRADIITPDSNGSYREFFLFLGGELQAYAPGSLSPFSDPHQQEGKVVGYGSPELAVNPPGLNESASSMEPRKTSVCRDLMRAPPCPEAIPSGDVGVSTVNYRNEPLALRILNATRNGQASGLSGDLAFVYRSDVTREIVELNAQPKFFGGSPIEGLLPGDPFTPMISANKGDRILVRLGAGEGEDISTVTIHGFRWLQDRGSVNSGWKNAQPVEGAQELEIVAPLIAGEESGSDQVDYLYKLGASVEEQWSGGWGLVRVYGPGADGRLMPLTDRSMPATIANSRDFIGVCPKDAPVRRWEVTAVTAADALPASSGHGIDLGRFFETGSESGTLVYNRSKGPDGETPGPFHDPTALLYVRSSDLNETGKLKSGVPSEPLILRAAAGECVEVTLHNNLPAGERPLLDLPGLTRWPLLVDQFNANQVSGSTQVGLHSQLLTYDGSIHDGTNVGANRGPDGKMRPQTVGPGQTINYRWYAGVLSMGSDNRLVATPVELGTTGLIPADGLKQPGKGLVGALIVEPHKARWVEDEESRASAFVRVQSERPFREHVAILQDGINLLDQSGAPVAAASRDREGLAPTGLEAMNYRSQSMGLRPGKDGSTSFKGRNEGIDASLLATGIEGMDPETFVFSSKARTPVRLRVVHPTMGGRSHALSLHGHLWEWMPYVANSMRMGSNPLSELRGAQAAIGPYGHYDLIIKNGAGGKFGIRGDFMVHDHTPSPYSDGIWGIFRAQ
ncbi:MAG: copper oxidase [Syntrophobacteraceae bacterium]